MRQRLSSKYKSLTVPMRPSVARIANPRSSLKLRNIVCSFFEVVPALSRANPAPPPHQTIRCDRDTRGGNAELEHGSAFSAHICVLDWPDARRLTKETVTWTI